MREYLEKLFGIVDKMGPSIILIPYIDGIFATGILESKKLALSEEEERTYICHLQRKPKFNHVAMKARIVISLKLERLKDPDDRKVAKDREVYNRHLCEA